MLKVSIDENGKVSSEEFLSGYSDLRDSALTAIKQWTYKPISSMAMLRPFKLEFQSSTWGMVNHFQCIHRTAREA